MTVGPLDLVLVLLGTLVALSLAVVATCAVVATVLLWTAVRRGQRALERLELAADEAARAAEAALRDVQGSARDLLGVLGWAARWLGPLLRTQRLARLAKAAAPFSALAFGVWYLLGEGRRRRSR